uniref:Transducin beta-like protein 2 n=1 Tax=Plectus sambesii TaxID=2011161 RepID=A0A914V925_9BILA
MVAATDPELFTIGVTFIVAAGIVAVIAYFAARRWDVNPQSKTPSTTNDDSSSESKEESKSNGTTSTTTTAKSKKKDKWQTDKVKDAQYDHPWLLTTLKGHTDRILDFDFASNGKTLVSCAEDRSLMLWNLKDFAEKEHKSTRGSVDLDHSRLVKFAPDSKSIILALAVTNKVGVYKLARREDGGNRVKFQPVDSVEFPEKHVRDIVSIGIACSGKFLMSASSDNTLVVYDLHGDILKTIETKLNTLHRASVSPCGRFIAASGFTPDVVVWEVSFDKGGTFKGANKAFELKGHTSGVYAFDFNQNSSRAVTASKDGSWKLFDTDIRYQQGEEAHEIMSGQWELLRSAHPESVFAAMAPSGDSFAIGANRHVRVYSAMKAVGDFEPLFDVHSEQLTSLKFSSCGRFFATAGDKYIRVFHNIPGYKSAIEALKEAIKAASSDAQKRRLMEQLEEEKAKFAAVLNENSK